VNETKTETRAWGGRAAADRPGTASGCRCESVNAEPGSGWAIVGNQQDLPTTASLGPWSSWTVSAWQIGALVDRAERRIRSACRGVVSLSLAGPGSDYVRRDDTAGGLGVSRSCYARYGTMVLPAGPEKSTFWATRGAGRLRTSPPRAGRRRDEFWPLRSGLQRPALAIVACPRRPDPDTFARSRECRWGLSCRA
jgi:hypothetical protein